MKTVRMRERETLELIDWFLRVVKKRAASLREGGEGGGKK